MTMPIPTAWTPLSPLGHHDLHSPAGSASIGVDGAIEVRDCEGRLRVRFDGREAEIITEGELALSAQSIRLEAAEDVTPRRPGGARGRLRRGRRGWRRSR